MSDEKPARTGFPFHRLLGMQMELGPNGEGIVRIEIDPERHMGSRWVHGGVIAALTDVAGGVAVATSAPGAMTWIDGTVQLDVNYLRKAREGDLTATARILRRGRRVAACEIDVTNKGELVAKGLATYMIGEKGARPESRD